MDLIFNSELYGTVGCIPYPIADGATEALEFYTDVISSITNEAEERSQLRALPRQYFKHNLVSSFGYQQEIANALRANLRGTWLVPLWFEAQRVAVAVGQATVPVDTLLHDLRTGSHALLFKSVCDWQLVTVNGITDTTIDITESRLSGMVYVVPLRKGRVSDNASAAPTGYNNEFELQYYIEDVLSGLTEDPAQLNGQDLYTVPYLLEGDSASAKILWNEEQVEYVLGNISSDTTWQRARYQRGYFFDGQGPQEYRELKNYFYRRAGRFRAFYSPTFESDLQKRSTGQVTNTFQFKDEGYVAQLFPTLNRLGFELADGSWVVRTATAASNPSPGIGQVTLNAALNVPASAIRRISYVTLNRLDTDRMEITLGQNGRFTTSASVVEIPE